jgi:hypothetical protein
VRHTRRDAHLDVQRPEQALGVGQFGLDLDDCQALRNRMPCEQINAASVAVLVEARLRHDRPIPLFEAAFPSGLERCMTLVE